MIKKFCVIALLGMLLAGAIAGCANSSNTLGGSPTDILRETGAAQQTGSVQDTDTAQQTGSVQDTDTAQQTENAQEIESTQCEEMQDENLQKLEIPVYNEDELLFEKCAFYLNRDASFYHSASGNRPHVKSAILEQRPTTALRVLSEEYSYAVYDTDTGYRLYLFFDDRKYPEMIGFPVIIKDMLSYSDFADLKIGDSIDKVEQIDSIVALYKKMVLELWHIDALSVKNMAKRGHPICTIHYLKNGILKINYTMPEEGRLVISEMIFNEDYCIVDSINRTVSHKIKNIDLPNS